jgi:hypothetical protein
MRLSRVLGGLAACVLLAGCATTKTHERAAPTTAPRDWRDAAYTITCDGVVPDGFKAQLRGGAATVPADVSQTPFYDSFDVALEATASGDLTDDGQADTVVLLQCHPQPSNGIVEEVQVFDAHDHLIAELPSPRTLPQSDLLPPVYDPHGLSVQNGEIVAVMKVYQPGDTHAGGPSGQETLRWRWNGKHFVQAS